MRSMLLRSASLYSFAHAAALLMLLAHAFQGGIAAVDEPGPSPQCTPDIVRRIAFGVGTGALQVEGRGSGRAPSVWEASIAKDSTFIADRSDPSVGTGFFSRYRSDAVLLRRLGIKHFRMSLSWPRLIPGGKKGSPVDPAAVRFYSRVLDALLAEGVQPLVALYHWDLPQSLQDAYGGLLSPRFVDDFVYYANAAFRLFGPRVRTWLTFIEPAVICNQQYGNGQFAPGINNGDKGRYACGHNLLLAHAAAAALYREKYRRAQGGRLSFSTLITWAEPAGPASAADAAAAQNKLDAEVGWFLDPVSKGDYPPSLRASKGDSMPRFTPEQADAVKGSLDFVAANCFSAKWVWAPAGSGGGAVSGWKESDRNPYNGIAVGLDSGIAWIDVVPWSQGRALRYVQKRYGDPQILISSSGVMGPGESKAAAAQQLQDTFRLNYYRSYLDDVCRTVKESKVRLIGWFAWSFLDSWEWREGYTTKFGIVRVSYDDGSLSRTPKASALWLSRHVFNGSAPTVPHQ